MEHSQIVNDRLKLLEVLISLVPTPYMSGNSTYFLTLLKEVESYNVIENSEKRILVIKGGNLTQVPSLKSTLHLSFSRFTMLR